MLKHAWYRLFAARHRTHALAQLRVLERKLLSPASRFAVPFAFRGRGAFRRIEPRQNPMEIEELYRTILALRPGAVLEIGTARGGTLYLWTQAARDDAVLVSVDLPGGDFGGAYPRCRLPFYARFALPQQHLHLLLEDSHRAETLEKVRNCLDGRPLDFAFIDGDHTYDGVRHDFEMYGPLVRPGGLIAFHDILERSAFPDIEVHRFWAEIKQQYPARELIGEEGTGTKVGIGLIEVPADGVGAAPGVSIDQINMLGPLAGVVTSVLWTGTSILFALAGRRLGSTVVNATRLALAIVVLALIHRFLVSATGTWVPTLVSKQVWLLALSGLIGLTIGDQCLFTAFVDIGPRLASLLMTTAPVFAAVISWFALGERLSLVAGLGMAVTIGGIGWVILERPRKQPAHIRPARRARGIVLAVAGGFCQAAGLMLSKAGMGHGWLDESAHLDPQAATLVRMAFAGVGMIPLLLVWRVRLARAGRAELIGSRRAGFAFTVAGTVVGPVFGVWMSLIAADATSVGIAQTLLSLTPLFILPYAAYVEKEHISWRAAAGAGVAVVGVAILFSQA